MKPSLLIVAVVLVAGSYPNQWQGESAANRQRTRGIFTGFQEGRATVSRSGSLPPTCRDRCGKPRPAAKPRFARARSSNDGPITLAAARASTRTLRSEHALSRSCEAVDPMSRLAKQSPSVSR
jgi:hypothetical protein